jgi:hypothetical protein
VGGTRSAEPVSVGRAWRPNLREPRWPGAATGQLRPVTGPALPRPAER